ncbi:MAG: WD40 repeat domain-containing protein, partial [Gemmataceae bacterium]
NNPVRTIAFAPDGTQIATGTDDGSVMLWNVRDGVPALPAALRHPARVNAVALSADGRKILTGCDDGHARVWDGSTGQLAGQPLSHDGPVLHIAPGPDGRLLATGSDDNTVRIWDSTTMEPAAAPFHHNATPSAVRFHPNGYEVLTADQTRLARVWNLITHGDITGTTTVELSDPATISPPTKRADLFTANSPDGTLVVTFGAEQSVRVRRTLDREPVTPPLRTGASITSAAFGPNGDTLVTGDADGNIMAWSVPEGRPVWTAPARHMSRIAQLGYDRTGTRICSCSEDNTARIWDPTTGTPRVPPIRLGATASSAAFNDDGRLLYTELPSGKARIWDSQTGEPITPVFPARADWAESVIAAKWPVEDMLAGGRMLSGQRLTESGDVIPTDANAMRDDWRQLKNRYSVIAQTEPKVLNKWRERQTSLAEKRQEWFSAGWHLVRLIEAHPQEPSYR